MNLNRNLQEIVLLLLPKPHFDRQYKTISFYSLGIAYQGKAFIEYNESSFIFAGNYNTLKYMDIVWLVSIINIIAYTSAGWKEQKQ